MGWLSSPKKKSQKRSAKIKRAKTRLNKRIKIAKEEKELQILRSQLAKLQ